MAKKKFTKKNFQQKKNSATKKFQQKTISPKKNHKIFREYFVSNIFWLSWFHSQFGVCLQNFRVSRSRWFWRI
jgi:hypothetical protein